jgi:hypothetical protein
MMAAYRQGDQAAMDVLFKPAAPSPKEAQNPAPVYKPGVSRGMDRLIQDQSGH